MELIVIGMAKPNEFGFPSGGFSLTLYYPFRESLTHQTQTPNTRMEATPKKIYRLKNNRTDQKLQTKLHNLKQTFAPDCSERR
jgi:hypothetical protein